MFKTFSQINFLVLNFDLGVRLKTENLDWFFLAALKELLKNFTLIFNLKM